MKMKVPEKKEEFPLGETLVAAELVHEKSDLKRVKLTFENGATVEFIHGSYASGAQVYVNEPPELVDKWRVTGQLISGVPVRALFDRESDAKDYAEGNLIRHTYVITQINVPEEDLEHNDGDEIPF